MGQTRRRAFLVAAGALLTGSLARPQDGLIVNLETAKVLGVTPPSSILLRADRVIE